MDLMCVAKITSRVKGHHAYNHPYKVGEDFLCHIEAANLHSNNAIVVLKKNKEVVGHVPEALAAKLHPLMKAGKVTQVTTVITGNQRKAPEGTWVLGGGRELPCTYFLYGPKICKRIVRDALKHQQDEHSSVL